MTTSVLIVEDEPSILELISYTCRTSGMEVRKAANVAEAKKNLEAAKPDIILLDWMLPDCAGLESGRTHQKLSNEPRYRSPFIGDLTRGTF